MHPIDDITDASRLAALDAFDILDSLPEPGFDDIVQLATQTCDVPVALVSLVTHERQWFKARVGFEPCETDLDRSVCKFVLTEPDILVIPDLTADPRTAANPLVTHEPHIRFYAGAPLRSSDGHVLGSLCVIDGKPRPEGLTGEQADVLRILARQVMTQLELRRALAERDAIIAERLRAENGLAAARAELEETAAYWRGLFQRLSEGFIIGEVVRAPDGRVTDWRYVEVNDAWGEMLGVDSTSAIGRTIREVFPGIEDEWVDEFGKVVERGESIGFVRQVETLQTWYEGRAFPLGHDRFGCLFLDITGRIKAEQRRSALLAIGDRLRDLRTVADMSSVTSEIVGRTLQVSRAGFGRLIDDHSVEIEPDWTREGVTSISGRHRFSDYGDLLNEIQRGLPLVIDDVRTDPRTADDPQAMLDVGIGALVNMPVLDRGKPVAVLIVHDTSARKWAPEELAFIRNVADRLEAAVARLGADEDQRVLNHELSHRMKNTFAMVQAIATQTLRNVADQGPVEAFSERLLALSTAHDMLLQENWSDAKLRWVVQAVVAAVAPIERFDISGPLVELGARATLSVSLLLHELATNALKYGALSSDSGRVALTWQVSGEGELAELTMCWRESGGPPAIEPVRKGFGSKLIRMGLIGTGGTELRFTNLGLQADFRASLAQVRLS